MINLKVNGQSREYDGDPEMPLLWYLREELRLTGTKYGCGRGLCGACTVHLGDTAVRSCVLPMKVMEGANLTTIEGLALGNSHPLQQAWIDLDVAQCGYCQSGQIMAAAILLKQNAQPSDQDIDRHMTNICRCGSYPRIRQAIHQVARSNIEPSPEIDTDREST